MRFSKEDIEEIRKKLELLYPPKNDWQLGKCVLPVKGEEEVVIMQGGRNVRCNLKDMYKFISMREFGSFVNMDEYAGLPVTNLEDAISYVDPVFRRKGMVLTFQTQEVYEDPDNLNVSRPVWETWQFTGEVSQWGDTDKWAKMWSQDVNNVRITGAKVEGRELFIKVGSTWVKTDIDFDTISGSLSQEDADKLVARISELEARVEELEANGGGGQSHDIVLFEGELSYSGKAPASGGSPSMTNTLRLTVNGSEQDVEITYSVDQLYAAVNHSTGQVTFSPATSQSQRTVVVTATCVYDGRSYTKTASAVQEALEPDVIALSGSLSYSDAVPAAGGSINPSNTLSLIKNGVAQNVVFSFSSNQSYASVGSSTGVVTFTASQSTSQRSATITASCTFEGQTYSRTAIVTQAAYVPPVVEEYVYAGSAKNTTSNPVAIGSFTAGASSTTKTVNYTPTELVNTIIAVCPSTMSLTSCVKHGDIEDDVTAEMLASVTNVTYENKSCKMYQFKYSSSIRNNAFTITFN